MTICKWTKECRWLEFDTQLINLEFGGWTNRKFKWVCGILKNVRKHIKVCGACESSLTDDHIKKYDLPIEKHIKEMHIYYYFCSAIVIDLAESDADSWIVSVPDRTLRDHEFDSWG